MQDNDFDVRTGVFTEAIRMMKEAFIRTNDKRIADAVLVLAELAFSEIAAWMTVKGALYDE